MAELKLNVKQKVPLILETKNSTSLRGEETEQVVPVSFYNGTGQIVREGDLVYTEGTYGEEGYLEITVAESFEMNDNGQIQLKIITKPNIYQSNRVVSYPLHNSIGKINFNYDSRPQAKDFSINNIENRSTYIFTANDFLNNVVDFDGDIITEVALKGDVSGIKVLEGETLIDYIEGTFISIDSITTGKLRYVTNDTDAAYEKSINYLVKDNKGISSEPIEPPNEPEV